MKKNLLKTSACRVGKAMNFRTLGIAIIGVSFLAGCADVSHYKRHEDEAWTIQGPPVTSNTTPLEGSFQCMSAKLNRVQAPRPRLTVGNIKDYTGKFSENEGGNPITQGGALMVMSALGKLGDTVRLHERFDTQVTELELRYIDRRYLGDGQAHRVNEPQGPKNVPWKPYYGGTIIESDYFIVGGITELNYNVQSTGVEFKIDGIGPGIRVYTLNVAVDLRIVDTGSLEVIKTTSLQKQITGYEVALDVFEFFGNTLVDFNSGMKSQEPMQLGVRTALELAVLELVGTVTGVDHEDCISFDGKNPQAGYADPEPQRTYVMPEPEEEPEPAILESLSYTVYFEEDSVALETRSLRIIDDAVSSAQNGSATNLLLEGHTDTKGAELYNLELSRQRAAIVQQALVSRGIDRNRISLVWYGESQPAVAPGDGVDESLNRRVLIQILED